MKQISILMLLVASLLSGCGKEEPATPVRPPLFSWTFNVLTLKKYSSLENLCSGQDTVNEVYHVDSVTVEEAENWKARMLKWRGVKSVKSNRGVCTTSWRTISVTYSKK